MGRVITLTPPTKIGSISCTSLEIIKIWLLCVIPNCVVTNLQKIPISRFRNVILGTLRYQVINSNII